MPRPRTTPDAAILAAAARAIARSGPGNLTLAMVAAEVGLAPATLVQRFGSKRGLLLALARTAETEVARTFEKARAGRRGPVDALHAALADVASGVGSREELANHIAFLQMDVADSQFREHAANHAWAMRREIAALLAAGVEGGELRKDCDIPQLARAVQVAYNGSLIGWALTGDGSLIEFLRTDVEHVLQPFRMSKD